MMAVGITPRPSKMVQTRHGKIPLWNWPAVDGWLTKGDGARMTAVEVTK